MEKNDTGTIIIISIVVADGAVAVMFIRAPKGVSVPVGCSVQGKQGCGLHAFSVEIASTKVGNHLCIAPCLIALGGSEKGFRPHLFEGIYRAISVVVSQANLFPILILAPKWYAVFVPTFSGRILTIVFHCASCSVDFGVMEFVLVFNALLYEDI